MSKWIGNVAKRIGSRKPTSKKESREETGKKEKREEAAKILSDVNPENAFVFSLGEGSFTGKTASNLSTFCEALETVDLKSVQFHLYRKDFENWVRFLGDDALALQMAKIRATPFDGEQTRVRVVKAISERIAQLRSN